MCIRDRGHSDVFNVLVTAPQEDRIKRVIEDDKVSRGVARAVSYTHLRAHETVLDLVCRLLLEKKKHRRIKVTS